MTPASPARIHLLPAKESPYVLVIRRKPSRWFHVIRWNTKKDTLEHGSWFRGKLYPKRCDISFDGQWMVYLAMGTTGNTWNGICRLPYLKTIAHVGNLGTWNGGGYWRDRRTLCLNQWELASDDIPFETIELQPKFGGEDLGVLYPKWERDGWQRIGDDYGTHRTIEHAANFTVVCEGDNGWRSKPTRKHPDLTARYVGYLAHGYTFRFALHDADHKLDDDVDSACWDSLGNLVYSREGILHKLSLSDLTAGRLGSTHDLEHLTPPSGASPLPDSSIKFQ